MARILLVEDDEGLREVISDYLRRKNYYVVAVENGKEARDVVLAGEFNLVISDVQMPFMDGIEFLVWLRGKSKIPFILMTGFTNLLETKKAADYGADGFLAKPFNNNELFKVVVELLAPKSTVIKAENQESLDNQFCKVTIDEFVARPKIDFDIYVRLKPEKYIKIANNGETLNKDRLKFYKEKGVDCLHIRKEDFGKLIQFNLQLSKVLINTSKIPKEKKINFIKYTCEVIMEKCFVDTVDRQAFMEAKDFMATSMSVMTEDDEIYNLIEVLNTHSDHLYAHCLGVAMYSVMIGKKLLFESPQTHFKLSMAGLFHDIGKKEIDRAIIEKPRRLITAEERKILETHPQRSREVMETIAGVPQDVLQIVYEHHEDGLGQGYPRAVPKLNQHPLSCIVFLADLFVAKALKSPVNPTGEVQIAIEQIERYDLDRVDKKAFAALKELVSIKKNQTAA